MNELDQLLETALLENHLSLSDTTQTKLVHFLKLIQAWNRVFNLTRIVKPRDMVYQHIIDSLILISYLKGSRFLDVGSGAGLPGIPLALADPQKYWTLLDKNNKKTRFLTQVVAELGLDKVEIVQARSEAFHPTHCYDGIVCRAFGTIRLFIESTDHLLCHNGIFIVMKGKYPQEELNDIPKSFIVTDVIEVPIKGANVLRHIVLLSKKIE